MQPPHTAQEKRDFKELFLFLISRFRKFSHRSAALS
jgi:hypothetical protein